MKSCIKHIALFLIISLSMISSSFAGPFISPCLSSLLGGHFSYQVGPYSISQGKTQHIGIKGLIGDRFTANHHNGNNAVLGFGYFVDGNTYSFIRMAYGVNAFYFVRSRVYGNVVQENLFTNLTYRYTTRHIPIYLDAKSFFCLNRMTDVTVDVGVGPNFLRTSGVHEYSLDGGVTIPDHIFSGQSRVVTSATLGVGLIFNHLLGCLPLEIDYRYFYLGQGHFKRENNQVKNKLHTGNIHAQALIFGISI